MEGQKEKKSDFPGLAMRWGIEGEYKERKEVEHSNEIEAKE